MEWKEVDLDVGPPEQRRLYHLHLAIPRRLPHGVGTDERVLLYEAVARYVRLERDWELWYSPMYDSFWTAPKRAKWIYFGSMHQFGTLFPVPCAAMLEWDSSARAHYLGLTFDFLQRIGGGPPDGESRRQFTRVDAAVEDVRPSRAYLWRSGARVDEHVVVRGIKVPYELPDTQPDVIAWVPPSLFDACVAAIWPRLTEEAFLTSCARVRCLPRDIADRLSPWLSEQSWQDSVLLGDLLTSMRRLQRRAVARPDDVLSRESARAISACADRFIPLL